MNTATKSFSNEQLRLDIQDDENSIIIRFIGKSFVRNPTDFILPILLESVSDATAHRKRITLDFSNLAYMNSSTLTPIIKILEKIRIGQGEITLLYRKSLKWQEISFSALVIFQTKDGRIQIKGV